MRSVNIHEAKTHLSRLINAAANGEPFIIASRRKAGCQGNRCRGAGSQSPAPARFFGRKNLGSKGIRPHGRR